MYELDITALDPAEDDLAEAGQKALGGETTYLIRDGARIAAIVPVFVAEEHDEDIDGEVASAAGSLIP
jgi:hypothetical protein